MGWGTYYTLLEKYNGDLSKATKDEMDYAARCNPNTPPAARSVAQEHWERDQKYKKAIKPE